MGQAAVYQWFRHLKEDQQLLEDDLYKGRQVVACNKETTASVQSDSKCRHFLCATWHMQCHSA